MSGRQSPFRPFQPRPEQMALRPDVSGNVINGLGEREFRRPEVIYWSKDPDTIPHGRMQKWFYTANPPSEAMNEARAERQVITEAPLVEVRGAPVDQDAGAWAQGLARFVRDGVCEMTGVAEMRDAWLFEGETTPFARVILLGVAHDYEQISKAPDQPAGAEVIRQYGRAAGAAKAVANWIRAQGWDAEPVTGPMAGSLTLIPPAIECGFGELGKHGSIINPELGASFRLAAVLTDAPFAATPKRAFGIDGFCTACRVCEDACPPEALSGDKLWVRGERKWYVDFDRCLPFFNETDGCAICVAVCPWSWPGVGLRLADKLLRRAERKAQEDG